MAIINVGPKQVFTSLNTAYDSAVSGDILLIDEGVYEEKLFMEYGKWVHMVGNTRYPGHGKVVMKQILSNDYILYLRGITGSPAIYFEGIRFLWSPRDDADSHDEPITFYETWGTRIFFNRCIIDASYFWSYIFNSNSNDLHKMYLHNCNVIWNPDTDFNNNGANQFDRNSSKIPLDIQKSVFSYMLECGSSNSFGYPNGAINNIANTSNTTSDMNDVYKMFDIDSASYASLAPVVDEQIYYINTDLGESKHVSRVGIKAFASASAGKIEFFASNNEIDWDSLWTISDIDSVFRVKNFYSEVFYRYFKVEITAVSTTNIAISSLIVLEKGNDALGFDYVYFPGKQGYGANFGDYKTSLPTSYYFHGSISDVVLDDFFIDTVTFNVSDKSSKIILSNDNHRANLSSSYKYTDYGVRTNVSRKTGKWYWEFAASSYYGMCRVGVATQYASIDDGLGADSFGWGYEYRTGNIYNNYSITKTGPISGSGDIIGIAYDAYNGKLWFSKNGEWMFDGDPESGINPTLEVQAELFPAVSLRSSHNTSSTVDFIAAINDLNYEIPEDFYFYGTKVIWKVKAINAETNELEGYTFSDPVDSTYSLITTYSGSHFLICEDTSEDPMYNDCLLGRLEPEVWI